MEYLETAGNSAASSDAHKILCCDCGAPIEPNPSNTCVACLRTKTDVAKDVPRQVTLSFCRFCERYLQPPSQWVAASLESRELMALCLKRLGRALTKVKLVDANFVWTEPHSKRLKVKLTVQAEVRTAILQQTFLVEYVVHNQMCDDCRRVEAKDTWNASVQVRQKSNQKKTLYYLEQLLMKYQATKDCTSIKVVHDGLDFYFVNESAAKKLSEFLQSVIPCRVNHSKKLVSHDANSNVYNYKYTFSVEVAPICKDNIICLPAKVARAMGGIGQICVVNKINNLIHLIDPSSTQVADISASSFFKSPFGSLAIPKQLTEYTIMDIEIIQESERKRFSGQGALSKKHVLADAWVVKSAELGSSEDGPIHCKTHLGHVLLPGDTALGFDLKNCNVNDRHLESVTSLDRVPDVVLVKKVFGDKARRNRWRKWKLKRMYKDDASTTDEYTEFMEDLEENPDMRQFVNLYKRKTAKEIADDDEDPSSELPEVALAEMLDDMELDSTE